MYFRVFFPVLLCLLSKKNQVIMRFFWQLIIKKFMLKILLKTYRAAFTEDDEINQNFTSSVNYFLLFTYKNI